MAADMELAPVQKKMKIYVKEVQEVQEVQEVNEVNEVQEVKEVFEDVILKI